MDMKFEKPNPEMIHIFDSVAPGREHGTKTRKMFGNPCSFVNGNMFMGIHNNRIILRLSEADREKFVKLGGRIFEPMPGRFMKEYVVVPKEMKTSTELGPWVMNSLSYASSLPPKRKVKRKK
jgi:TfoX/Sxy family transcriptional regulator of competence genes